jgi:hypothetical protein
MVATGHLCSCKLLLFLNPIKSAAKHVDETQLVALAGSVSFGVMVYMLRRPRSSEAQSSIESSQGADVTEKNSTESISKEIA